MATDPQLPQVLATAATQVDRVAEQLEATFVQVQLVAIRGTLGWSGPRSRVWGRAAGQVATELRTEAQMARSLAGVLRGAAGTARQRLHDEWVAAEEARRRAEAARRAAAQKGTA
jgi:hypothetical protein